MGDKISRLKTDLLYSPLGTDPLSEIPLQGVTFNTVRDKHNACAFVLVRPVVEPNRIVEDVLDTVNNDWATGTLCRAHDSFDSEQIRTLGASKRFERVTEGFNG